MLIKGLIRFVSWFGLFATNLFLFANIKTAEQGVGYPYLAATLACAAIVTVARPKPAESLVLRPSSLLLLAFFTYFLCTLFLNMPNINDIKGRSVGTTGGLFFGVAFGAAVSTLVGALHTQGRTLRALGTLLFLMLSVLLALDVFSSYLGQLRSDLFLVASSDQKYQRPGSFSIIIAIVVSFQLALAFRNGAGTVFGRTVVVLCGLLYAVLILLLMATCQLIGSNAGFIVTLFLAFVTVAWALRPRFTRLKRRFLFEFHQPDPFRAFIASLPRVFMCGVFFTAVSVALGLTLLSHFNLELSDFRVFGYSSGRFGGNSLTSRFELLLENFTTQFAYNPVFGNQNVDALTTGRGSYAHSLISMLSHLGVIGTGMFITYIAALWREMQNPPASIATFHSDWDLGLFRVMAMLGISAFAMVGTFFTWMPLWFSLGFLFPPLVVRRVPSDAICVPAIAAVVR